MLQKLEGRKDEEEAIYKGEEEDEGFVGEKAEREKEGEGR